MMLQLDVSTLPSKIRLSLGFDIRRYVPGGIGLYFLVGTVLLNYMLKDKVGRLLIDGIVDAENDYYNSMCILFLPLSDMFDSDV